MSKKRGLITHSRNNFKQWIGVSFVFRLTWHNEYFSLLNSLVPSPLWFFFNKFLKYLCPRTLWTKFGWNWPSCSAILWPFIFINLIPFNQRLFVPSLAEIGLVVLESKGFKYRQCIFIMHLIKYLPIWKGQSPTKFGRTALSSVLEKKISKICHVFLLFF